MEKKVIHEVRLSKTLFGRRSGLHHRLRQRTWAIRLWTWLKQSQKHRRRIEWVYGSLILPNLIDFSLYTERVIDIFHNNFSRPGKTAGLSHYQFPSLSQGMIILLLRCMGWEPRHKDHRSILLVGIGGCGWLNMHKTFWHQNWYIPTKVLGLSCSKVFHLSRS